MEVLQSYSKLSLEILITKKRLLRYATKLKSFHKYTRKDSTLYMTQDLTLTQRLENKRLQNELKIRKDNGEQDLMIRVGR